MNREIINDIFKCFYEKHLIGRGFVLRTPSLAERTFCGIRHGITWQFEHRGELSFFGCHIFWSFTHELDDAPPNAALSEENIFASGSCTPLVHSLGALLERDVAARLLGLLDNDMLDRLTSAESVLGQIERYGRSKHELLGCSDVVAPLNHAFCLETAGRNAEAARRYRAIVRKLEDERFPKSELAIRCKKVAATRAQALIRYLPQSEEEQYGDESLGVSIYQPDPETPIEVRLARRALPMRILPEFVQPNHFALAMEEAYVAPASFWRSINPERFVDELARLDPAYMEDVQSVWSRLGYESFRDALIYDIRIRQLDEYCATWLLTLSDNQDERSDQETYDLLREHLRAAGETVHLQYLALDGVKAVRHIKERLDELNGILAEM